MSAVLEFPTPAFRLMKEVDLPAVLNIERKAYQFPWTHGIFKDCVRVGYQCWVSEVSNVLIGYAVLSIAANECHLLNLCVDPEYQGQGFGRRLLREMIHVAHSSSAVTMFLEVRASNIHALSLYLDEGFNEIGVRSGYYPSRMGREDAIIYAREL